MRERALTVVKVLLVGTTGELESVAAKTLPVRGRLVARVAGLRFMANIEPARQQPSHAKSSTRHQRCTPL